MTEHLIEEHGLFRRALALFAGYAEQVVSGERHEPRLADAYLQFFRDFGDRRHHDKEERILFPWLRAHGLDSGPLVVLKHEHALGRNLRQDLDRAVRALRHAPRGRGVRVRFHGLVLRFAELLTAHMSKEEQVLFPLARQIGARNGGELRRAGGLPVRVSSWIGMLEADVAVACRQPTLSLHGLGTPEAFDRLCQQSLTVGIGDRRNSSPAALLRASGAARH